MSKQLHGSGSYTICMLLFLIATGTQRFQFHRFAEGSQRRIHVSDDLNDDERGNEKSELDTPPDLTKMSPKQIQEELMKKVLGPVFGFVKLRLNARRSPDMVSDIAKRWTNLARAGTIESKFISVDSDTIMFTMVKGQDTTELKLFLLDQEEAYEIKIGDQLFRRPGDPPFDEVFEKLQTTHTEL